MAHHKFKVGQLVDFAPSRPGVPTSGRQYEVVRQLPAEAGEFQYRVKSKAETFEAGWSGSGLGIDSQGNVWVTNRLGSSIRGAFVVADMILTVKTGGNGD